MVSVRAEVAGGPDRLGQLGPVLPGLRLESQLGLVPFRAARALELTYFGGLDARQVGEVLGVSVATVERDLKFGRAWLREAMS